MVKSFGVGIFCIASTGMVMGGFASQQAENIAAKTSITVQRELLIRIVEPVAWAIAQDESGATMQKFCDIFEVEKPRRTRQGVATVRCQSGEYMTRVYIDGRRHGENRNSVHVRFDLTLQEGAWGASEFRYYFFDHGRASP